MSLMVPSSYLRIYQPLDSFPAKERERWTAYISGGARLPSTVTYRDVEFEKGRGTGLLHPLVAEHAFVRRSGAAWLVCPWRVKLRMLVGLLAFRNALPGDVADMFVPEEHAARAVVELERLRTSDPTLRANIACAPWHVPLRWFVAFDDAERMMTFEQEKVRVRYETDLRTARSRVGRGLSIVGKAGMPEGVIGAMEELADWIDEFPPESLMELDYGSVAELFRPEELELDRSAGEVWACLEALEIGDFEESGRRYSELVEWWGRVQSLNSAN